MYKNNLVAAVKVNGKVLREKGEDVSLPFGSEYAIYLKNQSSVRMEVKVQIDGVDIADGTKFVIDPNSSYDIERFIRNGNFTAGNKLKFIERSESVEQARGIKAEDGLIRIEYWKEKIFFPTLTSNYMTVPYLPPIYKYYVDDRGWHGGQTFTVGDPSPQTILCNNVQTSGNILRAQSVSSSLDAQETGVLPTVENVEGITVPGSRSDQQFYQSEYFATEQNSEVMVIRLRGSVKGQTVRRPITVDIKPVCITCRKRNSSADNFCSNCGTSLSII